MWLIKKNKQIKGKIIASFTEVGNVPSNNTGEENKYIKDNMQLQIRQHPDT